MSTYTLNKLKTPKSRQGVAIHADLMKDGIKIATINDEGNGGAMFIDYINAEDKIAFLAFAVEQFELPCSFGDPDLKASFSGRDEVKAEYWINATVDKFLTAKSFDRKSKKKTLYRIEGERDWLSVTVPYSARVLELLEQRHGAGKIVAVWGAFGEQTF